MSIREVFCSSCVTGVRWFGVSFLKPVQQQKRCLYPAKSGPHCHIGLILNSQLVWFAHEVGVFTGLDFNKAGELNLGESPPQAHARMHILCPIKIGTIT